jgi:hypothetical protein
MEKCSYLLVLMLATVACGARDGSRDDATSPSIGEADSENGVFRASLSWQPASLKAGNGTSNTGHVAITALSGEPLSGDVELTGFHPEMPAMGHGTNEDDQRIETDGTAPGRFVVTGVHFSMAGGEGEWVVKLYASVEGKEDLARVALAEVE